MKLTGMASKLPAASAKSASKPASAPKQESASKNKNSGEFNDYLLSNLFEYKKDGVNTSDVMRFH